MLAEFSVDRESAVEIAGRRVVVENHSKPFPWIFRKQIQGKDERAISARRLSGAERIAA